VHTSLQIVFLNNVENFRSPFKDETLRQLRGPEIGKKILGSCNKQNVDNQVNADVGAHMKEYRNKWQATAGQSKLWCGNSFSASTI
jgi:hypothetical protein